MTRYCHHASWWGVSRPPRCRRGNSDHLFSRTTMVPDSQQADKSAANLDGRWVRQMCQTTNKIPVVPARSEAEVALRIYRTFLIYRTCMRRAPARPVRACTLRKLCPVSHVTFAAPLRTSHFSLHSSHSTLHTSHCTLRTPHFTSHCALKTAHFALHTSNFTVRTSHFTLHTALFTPHTSHCTLHTSHSTLHLI